MNVRHDDEFAWTIHTFFQAIILLDENCCLFYYFITNDIFFCLNLITFKMQSIRVHSCCFPRYCCCLRDMLHVTQSHTAYTQHRNINFDCLIACNTSVHTCTSVCLNVGLLFCISSAHLHCSNIYVFECMYVHMNVYV